VETVETHVESVETRKKPSRKDKRPTVTIHFTPGKDDDLIRLIFALGRGQRAPAVLGMLRGMTKPGKAAPSPQQMAMAMPFMPDTTVRTALDELVDGMRWMQDALTDLPAYLDRMLKPSVVAVARDQPPPDRETASEATLQERAERMKKAKW
jgi:hypothetical protein